MKHHWFKILLSFIGFSMGIFSWYYFYVRNSQQVIVENFQLVAHDGMICINHLAIPCVRLNKESSLSLEVQDSMLSPTSPFIVCHDVQGTILHNDKEAGSFKTEHMTINREKKTLNFPTKLQGQHALVSFSVGMMNIDIQNQEVIMEDGVESCFFISRGKQPQP